MDRRDFLKTLGAFGALAAFPNLLSSPVQVPPVVIVYKSYALGFTISQEMIEDDMWGPGGHMYGAVQQGARNIAIAERLRLDRLVRLLSS